MTPKKYNELNELLAEYSKLSADLAATESKVNKASVKAAEPLLPEYAETKAMIAEIEGRLFKMATENPELFSDDKKTHSTPFGSVSFRSTSSLQIESVDEALQRIRLACQAEELRAMKAKEPPRYTEALLIRLKEVPNIEALERLTDVELKMVFGITRKTEEKFTVKPLEVKTDKLLKKQKGGELREAA